MKQTSKPETFATTHDWEDDDPLSYSTVRALSRATDVDVEELPFLRESIAPDALDSIFAPTGYPPRTRGSLVFRHADHRITIRTDGVIEVEPVATTR